MSDEEHHAAVLPSVDALIAGTVALMTIWADPCPRCTLDPVAQRSVLAHKVVSNLYILSHHAGLSDGLRQVMGMAHERWAGLAHPVEAREGPGLPSATAFH